MSHLPHRIKYTDPLHAGRHPFQVYMLALTALSGFPLLIGKSPAQSLYNELPPLLEAVWGAMLFGGATIGLAGSYWRGRYLNALTLERIGLSLCGAPATIYGVVLLLFTPNWAKTTAALVLVGFGLSCLQRSRDVGSVIRRALTPDLETPTVDKEPGAE